MRTETILKNIRISRSKCIDTENLEKLQGRAEIFNEFPEVTTSTPALRDDQYTLEPFGKSLKECEMGQPRSVVSVDDSANIMDVLNPPLPSWEWLKGHSAIFQLSSWTIRPLLVWDENQCYLLTSESVGQQCQVPHIDTVWFLTWRVKIYTATTSWSIWGHGGPAIEVDVVFWNHTRSESHAQTCPKI